MRSIDRIAVLLSLTGLACESRPAEEEAAPKTETISATAPVARVVIEQPSEGAEVQRNVTIVLGTENIRLAPAGDTASGTGHHHLERDSPGPSPNLARAHQPPGRRIHSHCRAR
jgi:hypothetical protein